MSVDGGRDLNESSLTLMIVMLGVLGSRVPLTAECLACCFGYDVTWPLAVTSRHDELRLISVCDASIEVALSVQSMRQQQRLARHAPTQQHSQSLQQP